jgi:twitching motility protein PilT
MNINEVLQKTVELQASDLHITVGLPPMMRVNGMLLPYGEIQMTPEDTKDMMGQVLKELQIKSLEKRGEVDLSYHLPGISRFRVNMYKQRGYISMAFRVITVKIPTIDELGFPSVLKDLSLKQSGFILVTGPTGSGKSTTLAAMVNHINNNRNCHIIALEDPIEYLHKHYRSMINQREIGKDSMRFSTALRAALREDPDVIFVGEMRDVETIGIAITAAETGHLVMSTLHTGSADKTIDRIIDVFPPQQQQQIRIQLSGVLNGVISQKLLPTADGTGRVAALEIMIANNAVGNLIREGKTHQIHSIIQSSMKVGMRSMDYSLSDLLRRGIITREIASLHATDQEMLKRYLSNPERV